MFTSWWRLFPAAGAGLTGVDTKITQLERLMSHNDHLMNPGNGVAASAPPAHCVLGSSVTSLLEAKRLAAGQEGEGGLCDAGCGGDASGSVLGEIQAGQETLARQSRGLAAALAESQEAIGARMGALEEMCSTRMLSLERQLEAVLARLDGDAAKGGS